jgi:hypothetical protein
MSAPIMVPKDLGYQVLELLGSLQVIRDSLQLVRAGRVHQLIPVYGQLRAILRERRRGSKPLLLDLADELQHDLRIFSMPDVVASPPPITHGLILHVAGPPFTMTREIPLQEEQKLRDLLDYKLIKYKDRLYSVGDLIEFFANKAGGAHYSKDLPRDFAELLSFGLGGQPVLVNALVQVAQATLDAGTRFIQAITNFDVHMSVVFEGGQVTAPTCLFSLKYPKLPMQVSCIAEQTALRANLTSLDGKSIELKSSVVDWTSPHLVTVAWQTQDDLSCTLSVNVDGEGVGRINTMVPLFVSNAMRDYELTIHRSGADGSIGTPLGLITVMIFADQRSPVDSAQTLLHLMDRASDLSGECVYYGSDGYGIRELGKTDIQNTGNVTLQTTEKVLRGDVRRRS